MQQGRPSFREVCCYRTEHSEQRSLNDFSDDILARIFAFVVGPLKRQQHYINNGILVRHEHMEPTMVSNFDDIIILNRTCRRWHNLVQTSVELWKNVHISTVVLHIPRKPSSWMKMFFWLAPHTWKIECLHLADESSFRDNTLDAVKLGALPMLAHNLRTLHLDNCFHRGANSDVLSLLHLMRKLEQIQISCVNHDFIANISVLADLPNLKRFQIQGNGDYWDGRCPVLTLKTTVLPAQVEVISLANVRVSGFCERTDKIGSALTNLKVLELVYVEWVGLFVSAIACLHSLEQLYVIDCDKIIMDDATQQQEAIWSRLSTCEQLETFVLRNGRYGDFCMHMSKDFSGLSALTNLRELDLCPESNIPEASLYSFDDRIAGLSRLEKLSLTSIGLLEVPSSISGLARLIELDLSGNKLTLLPEDQVSFAACVRRLVLDSNAFAEIPNLSEYTSLRELYISNNPLKFSKDCEYLASLPSLSILRLGNKRPLDVFPILSASQVDEICKDLRLGAVGGFHLGSLCSSLRHRNPKCRLLM